MTYLGLSLHAQPRLGENLVLTLSERGRACLAVLFGLLGRHGDQVVGRIDHFEDERLRMMDVVILKPSAVKSVMGSKAWLSWKILL